MTNGRRPKLYLLALTLCLSLSFVPNARGQKHDRDPKAVQYLAAHEPELKETAAGIPRFTLLLKLASAAFEAGELEKAETYAREALTLGETLKQHPSIYGDAVHIGNIILGRVALSRGSTAKAREHLLAAGRTIGSPFLKTFGPNMSLAKELIEKGERGAAIAYLELCAKFWEMRGDKLDRWKEVIERGGVPSFGHNLNIGLTVWRKDVS